MADISAEELYEELWQLTNKALNSDEISYNEIIGALETVKMDCYAIAPKEAAERGSKEW